MFKNDDPDDGPVATREGGELDFSTFMNGAVNDLKGYVRAQKRYLKLELSERAAELLGRAVAQLVFLGVAALILLFLNIALALYLGERFASMPLGFVLAAAVYLLLFILFRLWWSGGGRRRFILGRINDLIGQDHVQEH